MALYSPSAKQTIPLNREKLSATTGDFIIRSYGATATRPAGLLSTDAGKYAHFDTTTQGWVVWTGNKWSDQ